MPSKTTQRRAQRDKQQGKAATTQAGEFVKEEMHHAKEGKHPVKNKKQAIAIGLSKARRSGVKLGAPKRGSSSTRKKAKRDSAAGQKRRGSSSSSSRSTGARRGSSGTRSRSTSQRRGSPSTRKKSSSSSRRGRSSRSSSSR